MASFLKRLQRIIAGKSNAALAELEDPEEQLSVHASELDADVERLHRAVSGAVADEKRLKMQIEELTARAAEWEKRAILALESHNETLAKEALVRRDEALASLAPLKKSWETQRAATAKLKASLVETKRRVEDAKRQYQLKLAQYRTAKATNDVTRATTGAGSGSPSEIMDRLDRKIADLEAETETALEMADLAGGASVEQAFRQLERDRAAADALAELKARIAQGNPART